MSLNIEHSSSDSIFMQKLRQEAKVMTNILFILEKVEADGHLNLISSTITSVIDNEILFALKELSKVNKKPNIDELKALLINNTYIFKENLKQITSYVSFLKSRSNMEE